jgi:hypothetical protein
MPQHEVWLFVDEFASLDSTPDDEYDEIEGFLCETLRGHTLAFQRDMRPHLLANASPRVYLFDIGGMCVTDFGGGMRRNWAHTLIRQLEDHPSTLFVPWTSMTGDSLRSALQEFLPEWHDPEAALPDPPARPNLWLPPESARFDWWKRPGLDQKLKEWFA